MKRYLFFVSFMSLPLFAELSAFDAGAIDSDNPYGLSESERTIIQNQKLIRQQALKIEQLQERIEGLSSVVDSLSSKLGKTGERLSQIDEDKGKYSDEDIKNLQAQIDEIKANNDQNYKKIDASLKKLTTLIGGSSLTSSKISKKSSSKKPKKRENSKPNPKIVSNSELLREAISAFRTKNYAKAESAFTKLASKSYKPAQTNYYLGEIAYAKRKYDDAITFYKRSVGYYDKASYMPKLLLHTALSFKNMGQDDNAEQFFATLVSTYPDSAEASLAQKYLN